MFTWAAGLIADGGYLGIALLMFLENLFPPIPSELIMPLAGFDAARGELNPLGVVAAGTVGSILGAIFWYWVGKRLGAKRLEAWAARHGRWLTLRPENVVDVDAWFDRHGGKAVLFGRLLPAFRSLVSIPAGVFGMTFPRFALYSTVGTTLWNTLLTLAGYTLESRYEVVAQYLNPATRGIVAMIIGYYLYRLATWRSS